MLEYFNKYEIGQYRGMKNYPSLNIINYNLNLNLHKVIQYCRKTEYHSLKTINVLTDLIYNLSSEINSDDFNYLRYLSQNAEQRAHNMGLTTKLGPGKSFNNILYKNATSYIIYTSKLIDLDKIKDRWRNYIPLRLIYNQDDDIDYEAKDGYKDLNNGVCFYELDVIRMLMMYKHWVNFRRTIDMKIEPGVFVSQFVYPNMLFESLNLNLFNRFISYVKYGDDYKLDTNRKNYPFYYLDLDAKINQALQDFIKEYSNKGILLGRLINSLPVFSILNNRPKEMLAFLRTNVPSRIRQTSWFLWYTRLPYLRYLLEFLGEEGFKYNIGFFRSFQREFLLYRSNGILRMKGMPPKFQEEIDGHMAYILENVIPNLK